MKKGLICLCLLFAFISILSGCSKRVSYEELMNAINANNYTIEVVQDDFFTSIQYYDKENNAVLTENHFGERIEKDYTFLNDGKIVSVIYTNYKTIENEDVLNEDGKFECYSSTVYDEVTIDNVFESYYVIEKLFVENKGKIASSGQKEAPKLGSEKRIYEAKNIESLKGEVKFDLYLIDIQDMDDRSFDRNVTYSAKIYNLKTTKVEITEQIKNDIVK